MRGVAPIVALGAMLSFGGCVSRTDVDLKKLKQKIEEMAQDQSHSLRRIEELNNRIFLLEDKVDTSRVAMERSGRRPRLPVIRLRPPTTSDDLPEGDEDDEDQGQPEDRAPAGGPIEDQRPARAAGKSVVDDRAVAYSGAARRTGPRPVLRLYGTPSTPAPAPRRAKVPLKGPDPAGVTEKLPVVPMPRRKLARQMARGTAKGSALLPMKDYESARQLYQAGRLTAAAAAFRSFVGKYTRHTYSDNALYWMGECFYDMKNYRPALKLFRRVVEEYPAGNKAPDALLKMAFSYLKLKEKANAKTVLAQLVESFPRSPVARLASKTLVKMQ
jgi:tol-pal system protein YbgF